MSLPTSLSSSSASTLSAAAAPFVSRLARGGGQSVDTCSKPKSKPIQSLDEAQKPRLKAFTEAQIHFKPDLSNRRLNFTNPSFEAKKLIRFLADKLHYLGYLESAESDVLIQGRFIGKVAFGEYPHRDKDVCFLLRPLEASETKNLKQVIDECFADFVYEKLPQEMRETLKTEKEKRQFFYLHYSHAGKFPPSKTLYTFSLGEKANKTDLVFLQKGKCRRGAAIADFVWIADFLSENPYFLSDLDVSLCLRHLKACKCEIYLPKGNEYLQPIHELLLRILCRMTDGHEVSLEQDDTLKIALAQFLENYPPDQLNISLTGAKTEANYEAHLKYESLVTHLTGNFEKYAQEGQGQWIILINLLFLLRSLEKVEDLEIYCKSLASILEYQKTKDQFHCLIRFLKEGAKELPLFLDLIHGAVYLEWIVNHDRGYVRGYDFLFSVNQEPRFQFALGSHFLFVEKSPEKLVQNFLKAWRQLKEQSEGSQDFRNSLFGVLKSLGLALPEMSDEQILQTLLKSFEGSPLIDVLFHQFQDNLDWTDCFQELEQLGADKAVLQKIQLKHGLKRAIRAVGASEEAVILTHCYRLLREGASFLSQVSELFQKKVLEKRQSANHPKNEEREQVLFKGFIKEALTRTLREVISHPTEEILPQAQNMADLAAEAEFLEEGDKKEIHEKISACYQDLADGGEEPLKRLLVNFKERLSQEIKPEEARNCYVQFSAILKSKKEFSQQVSQEISDFFDFLLQKVLQNQVFSLYHFYGFIIQFYPQKRAFSQDQLKGMLRLGIERLKSHVFDGRTAQAQKQEELASRLLFKFIARQNKGQAILSEMLIQEMSQALMGDSAADEECFKACLNVLEGLDFPECAAEMRQLIDKLKILTPSGKDPQVITLWMQLVRRINFEKYKELIDQHELFSLPELRLLLLEDYCEAEKWDLALNFFESSNLISLPMTDKLTQCCILLLRTFLQKKEMGKFETLFSLIVKSLTKNTPIPSLLKIMAMFMKIPEGYDRARALCQKAEEQEIFNELQMSQVAMALVRDSVFFKKMPDPALITYFVEGAKLQKTEKSQTEYRKIMKDFLIFSLENRKGSETETTLESFGLTKSTSKLLKKILEDTIAFLIEPQQELAFSLYFQSHEHQLLEETANINTFLALVKKGCSSKSPYYIKLVERLFQLETGKLREKLSSQELDAIYVREMDAIIKILKEVKKSSKPIPESLFKIALKGLEKLIELGVCDKKDLACKALSVMECFPEGLRKNDEVDGVLVTVVVHLLSEKFLPLFSKEDQFFPFLEALLKTERHCLRKIIGKVLWETRNLKLWILWIKGATALHEKIPKLFNKVVESKFLLSLDLPQKKEFVQEVFNYILAQVRHKDFPRFIEKECYSYASVATGLMIQYREFLLPEEIPVFNQLLMNVNAATGFGKECIRLLSEPLTDFVESALFTYGEISVCSPEKLPDFVQGMKKAYSIDVYQKFLDVLEKMIGDQLERGDDHEICNMQTAYQIFCETLQEIDFSKLEISPSLEWKLENLFYLFLAFLFHYHGEEGPSFEKIDALLLWSKKGLSATREGNYLKRMDELIETDPDFILMTLPKLIHCQMVNKSETALITITIFFNFMVSYLKKEETISERSMEMLEKCCQHEPTLIIHIVDRLTERGKKKFEGLEMGVLRRISELFVVAGKSLEKHWENFKGSFPVHLQAGADFLPNPLDLSTVREMIRESHEAIGRAIAEIDKLKQRATNSLTSQSPPPSDFPYLLVSSGQVKAADLQGFVFAPAQGFVSLDPKKYPKFPPLFEAFRKIVENSNPHIGLELFDNFSTQLEKSISRQPEERSSEESRELSRMLIFLFKDFSSHPHDLSLALKVLVLLELYEIYQDDPVELYFTFIEKVTIAQDDSFLEVAMAQFVICFGLLKKTDFYRPASIFKHRIVQLFDLYAKLTAAERIFKLNGNTQREKFWLKEIFTKMKTIEVDKIDCTMEEKLRMWGNFLEPLAFDVCFPVLGQSLKKMAKGTTPKEYLLSNSEILKKIFVKHPLIQGVFDNDVKERLVEVFFYFVLRLENLASQNFFNEDLVYVSSQLALSLYGSCVQDRYFNNSRKNVQEAVFQPLKAYEKALIVLFNQFARQGLQGEPKERFLSNLGHHIISSKYQVFDVEPAALAEKDKMGESLMNLMIPCGNVSLLSHFESVDQAIECYLHIFPVTFSDPAAAFNFARKVFRLMAADPAHFTKLLEFVDVIKTHTLMDGKLDEESAQAHALTTVMDFQIPLIRLIVSSDNSYSMKRCLEELTSIFNTVEKIGPNRFPTAMKTIYTELWNLLDKVCERLMINRLNSLHQELGGMQEFLEQVVKRLLKINFSQLEKLGVMTSDCLFQLSRILIIVVCYPVLLATLKKMIGDQSVLAFLKERGKEVESPSSLICQTFGDPVLVRHFISFCKAVCEEGLVLLLNEDFSSEMGDWGLKFYQAILDQGFFNSNQRQKEAKVYMEKLLVAYSLILPADKQRMFLEKFSSIVNGRQEE